MQGVLSPFAGVVNAALRKLSPMAEPMNDRSESEGRRSQYSHVQPRYQPVVASARA